MPDILKSPSGFVDDLNITCQVPFTVNLGEVREGFVCDIGHIKFVIAN
jgi:hypothetical protein